jgi:hypothetical protein
MTSIVTDGTDENIGLQLDWKQVEELRRLLGWLRGERGLRLKDIARAMDVPAHSLGNFVRHRSRRPANLILGRLYRYLAANRNLLPKNALGAASPGDDATTSASLGILARYGLVKLDLPIGLDDLRRVYDRYTGYYHCFSLVPGPRHRVMCSLLHVRAPRLGANYQDADLPLPRFTFMTPVPNPLNERRAKRYVIVGYVISRNGNIFLTGHYDGELQYLVLKEARDRRFQYLRGVLLTTLLGDGAPAAVRIVCQRLDPEGDRASRGRRVKNYDIAALHKTFDGSDTILAGLKGQASEHRG